MPTDQEINKLIAGELRDQNISARTYESDKILLHSEGKGFDKFITTRHPTEPDWIKDYRLKNFRKITQQAYSKVRNVISKITRAEDFIISYNPINQLPEADQPSTYFEKEFPKFGSLHNWIDSQLIDWLLTEPNGLIVAMPTYWTWSETEYPPIGISVFKASQVKAFGSDYYYIKLNHRLAGDQKNDNEQVYLLVTDESFRQVQVWDKANGSKDFLITDLWDHRLELLPAFRIGGIPASNDNQNIYQSFIAGATETWTEALVQYSDLQGSIKQHIYPERAVWEGVSCKTCNGYGYISRERYGSKEKQNCPECNGIGRAPSPYRELVMKPPKADQSESVPDWAPAKYIEKDIEPVNFIYKKIKEDIASGFSALNMEFLDKEPLNESGKAKEFDRDELNSTLYNIAKHIVQNITIPAIRIIMIFRYQSDNLNRQTLIDNLPSVSIPVRYNVATASVIEHEIASAQESGIERPALQALNLQYAEKKFKHNPELKFFSKAVIELDPLAGKNTEQKVMLLSNNVIRKLDFVLSSNIDRIIREAINRNGTDFYNWDYIEKKEAVENIAQETLTAIDGETAGIPTPGNQNLGA